MPTFTEKGRRSRRPSPASAGHASAGLVRKTGAVASLQRTIGNRAVSRLLENQADDAARGASRDPLPATTHAPVENGARLAPGLRAALESRLDHDFGGVRIHPDADTGGARAIARGRDIYFGPGQFAPERPEGSFLLAHELAHVAQQSALGQPMVQAKGEGEGSKAPALQEVLPSVDPATAAKRTAELYGVFGAELDEIAEKVRQDPAAMALTKAQGTFALLALVDTRGPDGFDVDRAKKALEEDAKLPEGRRIYHPGRLESRPRPDKTLWFYKAPEKRPPPKDDFEALGMPKGDVDVDPTIFTLVPDSPPAPDEPPLSVSVRYAFPRGETSVRTGKAEGAAKEGQDRVNDAIKLAMKSLINVPKPLGPANVQREQRRTRARLAEGLIGMTSSKPLNIFLATSDLEINVPLITDTVFVRQEDVGDPAKLEAAVRVPLVTFLSKEVPFAELKEGKKLTPANQAEAVLHEVVHALLQNRGIGAKALWEELKGTVVGPALPKERFEDALLLYLLAQEELWVYGEVIKLGAGYERFAAENGPVYEQRVQRMEAYFADKGITLEKRVRKIDVTTKVAKKNVDWSITFRFPKKVVVSGADLTPLNALLR